MANAPEPAPGGHEIDIDPFHALSEGSFWFWDGKFRYFAQAYYDWPLIVVIIGVAFALFGRKEKALQAVIAVLVISACLNLVYTLGPWVFWAIKRPGEFSSEAMKFIPATLAIIAMGTFVVPILASGLGYGLGWLIRRVIPSRPA